MKIKIIIILITTVILSVSYSVYNFTISNYEYKNTLQKNIESFENINARIDKHISDSSNYLYYNLDYMQNEFIKVDDFFTKFSTERIILQNQNISKKLQELKSIFKKKDLLSYKFQKTNIILKNSTIYLSTLLSKSQDLFNNHIYLSLVSKSISNIYLAKSSADADFLINLNKDIFTLKEYKFSSKDKQQFNTMLIAHLNVYNTQYKKYTLCISKLSDDIYITNINNFKYIIYKAMDKKLSLVTIYLWIYAFLLIFFLISILYLIKRNQQQKINILIQSKNAQMGEMIGNIAHQWRQPLSMISTSASGMQVEKDIGVLSDDRFNNYTDKIMSNVDYLSKTIDTFRNYIREEKELKTVVLQDRINIAINIIDSALKDNNIKLINNIDNTNPIKITIVIGELSQVIINLFNNAKDIIKEKKIADGWIKIDLKKIDQNAIITIEDNGGGVPSNIINKIFDPYFTTKHKSVGTGLGLHMSKDIIEKSLNGHLSINNSNNGAIFTIELPL